MYEDHSRKKEAAGILLSDFDMRAAVETTWVIKGCRRQAECSRPLNQLIDNEINLIHSVFMTLVTMWWTWLSSCPSCRTSSCHWAGALVILVLLGFIWIQIFRLQGRRSGDCWTSDSIMSFFLIFFFIRTGPEIQRIQEPNWTNPPVRKRQNKLFSQLKFQIISFYVTSRSLIC